MNEKICIGKIVGVYGVKGWLKVHSFTSPPENMLRYANWELVREDGNRSGAKLRSGKPQGKGIVIALAGVDDRDMAKNYVGCQIEIESSELPVLEEGEFYWRQLEGLTVVTSEGVNIGRVSHLIETGANDVLVVAGSAESIDKRERLIPYLPGQFIENIDLDKNLMVVDWDPDF
ncbi:ribosome maturation factor RimM [Hahella sp. HN01]|uniref:ribosome maturation factor RimM n=1 Tax=Hahella sp. HN01 TaxID=2847262 RepID=UPI001C1EB84D|nr:ribosome maturation factor RimM [Hahella sp. HN01]MBU6953749.1 ribosome maturation factor RimM [Hahella sp. HN01]